MGFLSFNLPYYKERIEYFEGKVATASDVYEAKQLLKAVDDLVDEGYFELFYVLQNAGSIVDRLKAFIAAAGEKPFSVQKRESAVRRPASAAVELTEYIDGLISRANACASVSDGDPFLTEIDRFADAVEYDERTAYIFLLRDALLPYIFFKNKNRKNIYPFIISRDFLHLFYKDENIDDAVRAVIFEALERGHTDFEAFSRYCKRRIPVALSPFPKTVAAINDLLSEIKSEKILVVESGCNGTFPMLLSALDERIDFLMYTALPYLLTTYKNRIFTSAYEKMRSFETLYCQNGLFRIADFNDNKFYVAETSDPETVKRSLEEISLFLKR